MKRDLRILTAACALALGAAFLILRAKHGIYYRYTSDPLPDGTRYTFLYPARVTGFDMTNGALSLTTDYRSDGLLINLARTLSNSVVSRDTSQLIEVTSLPIAAMPATWHGEKHPSRQKLDLTTWLVDRRHTRVFQLWYYNPLEDQSDPAEGSVVAESFALLPPDAGRHQPR